MGRGSERAKIPQRDLWVRMVSSLPSLSPPEMALTEKLDLNTKQDPRSRRRKGGGPSGLLENKHDARRKRKKKNTTQTRHLCDLCERARSSRCDVRRPRWPPFPSRTMRLKFEPSHALHPYPAFRQSFLPTGFNVSCCSLLLPHIIKPTRKLPSSPVVEVLPSVPGGCHTEPSAFQAHHRRRRPRLL